MAGSLEGLAVKISQNYLAFVVFIYVLLVWFSYRYYLALSMEYPKQQFLSHPFNAIGKLARDSVAEPHHVELLKERLDKLTKELAKMMVSDENRSDDLLELASEFFLDKKTNQESFLEFKSTAQFKSRFPVLFEDQSIPSSEQVKKLSAILTLKQDVEVKDELISANKQLLFIDIILPYGATIVAFFSFSWFVCNGDAKLFFFS